MLARWRPMNDLAYILADLLSFPPLVPALWSPFWCSLVHLHGESLARLLRWLLVSGAASAGGGVPLVYYGWVRIPLTTRVGQLAGSFVLFLQPGISDFPVVVIEVGKVGISPASYNRRIES
jgi:hypothetical protein